MSDPVGLFGHSSALLGAQLAYLRARLRLAGIEGREAALHFAIIVGLGVGALVAIVFGYLFFVIAIVFLIAWAIGGENVWIWVTLGAAVVHFTGAVSMAFIAKARLTRPVFPATLDEFKKDQEWLKASTNPN